MPLATLGSPKCEQTFILLSTSQIDYSMTTGQISSAVVQSSSTEDTTQRIGHRFWCVVCRVNRRGGSFASRK